MADITQLSPGQIEKILTKSIKQAVAQSSLSITRSGNKELGFLVKEVASAPFGSAADVQKAGTILGKKIVEISQESDQSNLDAGVVRRLRFKQDWSAEFDIPESLPVEKVSKKATKSMQTLIAAPASADEPQETLRTPDAKPAPAEPEEDTELSTKEEAETAENTTQDDTAAAATAAIFVSEDQEVTTMPAPSPDGASEAAIAPEVAATSPKSAEADALLADESDEAQTLSSEPAEVATSEESTEIIEAAEAEVIEKVNSSAGTGANTAMSVDPESAAAVNADPTTREKA